MIALLSAAAAIAGNREPMLVASLVHQGGGGSPWGVEVGAEELWAVGDHCGWLEYPDCRSATWWPTAGVRGVVSYRGGTRVGVDVEGVSGVAAIADYTAGFFPIFELAGTAGVAAEFGVGPSLTFGGRATKSLSVTTSRDLRGPGTSYRDYGLPMLSGVFALQERWSSSPLSTRWSGGLQLGTGAATLY